MKHPKARTPKKSVQASRTITKQSAMSDINRGLDSMNLITSNLEAHEIPALRLDLPDGEVFDLADESGDTGDDTVIEAGIETVAQSGINKKITETHSEKHSANEAAAQATDTTGDASENEQKEKPQTRFALPPKPFTIISGFRK
jgi:hypothetical protein